MSTGRKHSTVDLAAEGPIVILAGAGLSKSIGLPLQAELLRAVVPEEIIQFHNYFMGRDLDDDADLETFLSTIDFDNMLQSPSRSGSDLSSRTYLNGFCTYIEDRMAKMPRRPEFWHRLATLIESADAFVTTNWDTLIEVQINALGLGVAYFKPRKGFRQILKLHGSIDWVRKGPEFASLPEADADLFSPIFAGHLRYRPFSEALDGRHILGISEPIAELLNKSLPAIIAPTHLKEIPNAAFRRIWSAASHALHFAKQIIVIGYSLPVSDILMRLLLNNSLRYRLREDSERAPEIIIIDPDPQDVVRSRYYELLGPKITFIREKFLNVDFQ